jgi:hypothetical protein
VAPVRSITAVAFAVLLAAVACGSSDVSRDSFSSALQERTELTKAQVTCVVDKTFDAFDQDAINDLYTASDRKDVANADEKRFEKIVEGCVGG